jgi:transketolase
VLKKINQIKKLSYKIRKIILDVSYNCGEPTHIGGALSIVEILSVIYSNFEIKVKKPVDRFILSKGHGFLALLAVLHCKGFIKKKKISLNFKKMKVNSLLIQ